MIQPMETMMTNNRNATPDHPLLNRSDRSLAARLLLLGAAACAPVLLSHAVEQPRPIASVAASGGDAAFDRRHFDLYAKLGAPAFDRALARLDNWTMSVGGARPIDIRMGAVSAAFRPGYPAVTVPATARDRMTGAETEIMIEARLLIEEAPNADGAASLQPVPVRVVPKRKWSLHNLAGWDFSRRLRAIEAADLSDAPSLPVAADSGVASDDDAAGSDGLLAIGSYAAAPIAGGLRLG